MSILRRIQRIASAEIHDLLDHLDPSEERLSRMAKDLETEWSEALQTATDVAVSVERFKLEIKTNKEQLKDLEEHAKVALRIGDDDKARTLIVERMDLNSKLSAIEHELKQAERTLDKSRRDLARLRRRLIAIQRKQDSVPDPSTTGSVRRAMETIVDRIDGITGLDDEEQKEIDAEILESMKVRESDDEAPAPATLAERLRKLEVESELSRLREEVKEPVMIEADAELVDSEPVKTEATDEPTPKPEST